MKRPIIVIIVIILSCFAAYAAHWLIGSGDKQKVISAKASSVSIIQNLDLYKKNNGAYPSIQQSLNALIPQYINKIPRDPWGNDFLYIVHGNTIQIISYGRDGKSGGEGFDADITVTN